MKCPHCGARNLPTVTVCGTCGRGLQEQAEREAPLLADRYYPPRARHRATRTVSDEVRSVTRPRLSERLGLRFPALRRRFGSLDTKLLWVPVAMTLLRAFAGVVPGLRLLRLRPREGWSLFGGFILSCLLVVTCLHNGLSNWALWTILASSIVSVGLTFFALWRRDNRPPFGPLQALGPWLMIVAAYFWAYSLGAWVASPWVGTVMVNFQSSDPIIRTGNALLYNSLGPRNASLRNGDYVLFEGRTRIGQVESVQKNVLVRVRVPRYAVLGGQQYGQDEVAEAEPDDVWRVVAVLNPPERRRWLP